ncbi:MAG: hypothetical protein DI533_00130 [Cereibacter sphaeroides]|uniref:Uncharacterized protein n=1 Tax=Cereibacter sphaeroides TaxID=1063 RepID=A0A2W5SBC7_CERSP|nr:MAG: hypothetical protein DI533_00130 [Cereibacter sphaeroides]
MQARIALIAILLAQPALAAGPIAEVICAERPDMVKRLTETYGASLTATGVRDMDAVMEVWTAPSGNWTLVQSYANGRSCILAMGADWEMPREHGAG